MSCLHPYLDFFAQFSSRLTVLLRFCLLLFFLSRAVVESQNVNLVFPVFNETTFSCTGIPAAQRSFCWFNTTYADLLPPAYNDVYPNQAGRMMYRTPIELWTSDQSALADFSTFVIFSVSHVNPNPALGSGLAFLIAPGIDTPSDSGSGSFGLFSWNPLNGMPTSGTAPSVVAVEFDTAMTPGIDVTPVPHIGLDVNSVTSINVSTLDAAQFLDAPVGMWIDYNNTLKTISIYSVPIGNKDPTGAASLKPAVPLIKATNFTLSTLVQRTSYIGISAGVISGEYEDNKILFWSFQTSGLPSVSLLAQWLQWFSKLPASKKIAVVAGVVVGTVGGAYACSECLFFLFFQRIKKPATPAEQAWPVRRRTVLPGMKEKLPRRKVRDSLSVASPLDLWETPLGPEEGPHVDALAPKSPKANVHDELPADSSDEDSLKKMTPGFSEDVQDSELYEDAQDSAVVSKQGKGGPKKAKEDAKPTQVKKPTPQVAKAPVPAKKPAQAANKKVAFEAAKPSSPPKQSPGSPLSPRAPAKPSSPPKQAPGQGPKAATPQSKPGSPAGKGPGQLQAAPRKMAPKPPRPSPQASPKAGSPR